ncbi:MAG: addiction module component [Flammeovirgaceae bacterium]
MDIAVKKVQLIEWLTKVQDKSVLKKIESLRTKSIKESYENKLKPMSSKVYKAMLDASMEEYKKGRVVSQRDLERESENW